MCQFRCGDVVEISSCSDKCQRQHEHLPVWTHVVMLTLMMSPALMRTRPLSRPVRLPHSRCASLAERTAASTSAAPDPLITHSVFPAGRDLMVSHRHPMAISTEQNLANLGVAEWTDRQTDAHLLNISLSPAANTAPLTNKLVCRLQLTPRTISLSSLRFPNQTHWYSLLAQIILLEFSPHPVWPRPQRSAASELHCTNLWPVPRQ